MKNKFDKLKANLKPKPTWKSLLGIIIFFFLPEIVAYFWGKDIKTYCNTMANLTNDMMTKQLYNTLEMFSQNSILNILIGFLFLIWWFYERKKR